MITIDGELKIRVISGRNGPFSVGDLSTSIGQFAIKDIALDQYEEGRYRGRFTITRIAMSSYTPRNSSFTIHEMRAFLDGFVLFDVDETPIESESMIPDPLDEEGPPDKDVAAPPVLPVDTVQPDWVDRADDPVEQNDADHERLQGLFGSLWPLKSRVKLDPTCDRGAFRQQRDALKSLGYRFDPKSQEWLKA